MSHDDIEQQNEETSLLASPSQCYGVVERSAGWVWLQDLEGDVRSTPGRLALRPRRRATRAAARSVSDRRIYSASQDLFFTLASHAHWSPPTSLSISYPLQYRPRLGEYWCIEDSGVTSMHVRSPYGKDTIVVYLIPARPRV